MIVTLHKDLSETAEHGRSSVYVQTRYEVETMCEDDRKKFIAREPIYIIFKGMFTLDTLSGKYWDYISGAQLNDGLVRAAHQ